MKKNKKTIEQQLKKYAVPWENVRRKIVSDFTNQDKQLMEEELRKYDMLLTLRRLREKLKLTQEKLAEVANVPRTTITKIESGNYNPTIHTLDKIARALGKKLEVRFV